MSAPNLIFSVEPAESGAIVYLPLAPKTSTGNPAAHLAFKLIIKNNEGRQIVLNMLSIAFTGPPEVQAVTLPLQVKAENPRTKVLEDKSVKIDAHATAAWFLQPENNITLPMPVPQSITLSVWCDDFSDPVTLTFPLQPHQGAIAGASHDFPAKAHDVRGGEYWPAMSASASCFPAWAEVTRTGIPEAAYHAEFDHIINSGYRPVWIDAYEVNSKVFFNAIFLPADGVAWAARHGMTATQYQGELSSRTGLGFHPLQIETYLSGNEVRYASIFIKSDAPAAKAYHGLAQDQHQQKFTSLTRDGWRPVNISVVESHNKLMYAALYEKRDVGTFATRNVLTAAEFQTQFDANAKAGRKLTYLNAYSDVGVAHFSAIWNEKAAPVCARHGMTADQFQLECDKQLADGLHTRVVTGYEDGNSHRFAAIWQK